MPSWVTAQFFIYNTSLTTSNNFPLLRFECNEEMHEFIKTLICFHPAELKKNEPYAALNNPQFLPDEVRVFLTKNGKIDCNFKLCDNLTQFKNCVINNNTNEKTGFCEVINELVNKSMEKSTI
jgi:hypothetical protein